jgi:serine/threonine-protein kinase
MTCPSCGRSNAPSQRFCGQCGAPLDEPGAVTHTSPAPGPQAVRRAGSSGSDAVRFVPGSMLGGRYRIVGLLGRGGMGEVYRADDLKLGQPVALKFLPRDVEHDRDRLERFLTEVRLSLRVTHPNVCRVFDIAEIDGRHYLSMEYVDGEDLASLLRRIGRLPEDKAIEIARQLCAGLAAAHDEGVLHRDLKPANVMIDGRGRAKITDFGLAGATAGIAGHEARAGTPLYMAPEQIEGRELNERTDIYSLGLVLYELFTGKRAFHTRDLTDPERIRSSTPTSPSAHVTGLDPAIERAILRCVDPDPDRRPASASQLAAALPGGDPLAMAIAAGETPSPEMVARAGGRGALSPGIASACLAVILIGLAGIWYANAQLSLLGYVPLPTPPGELAQAARSALMDAGYRTVPYRAYGFQLDNQYFSHMEKDTSLGRWNALRTVAPAPIWFWYRESPLAMGPTKNTGVISATDPPLVQPGMSRVRVDPAGRLQQLEVVPSDLPESPGPWSEPDWTPLFTAAGLDLPSWTPADPMRAPPHASDVRRAWTRDDLRIEAAAFRGRPVWFVVAPPWREARSAAPEPPSIAQRLAPFVMQAIAVFVIAGGIWIARRNIRQGRSDRRGALRLAMAYVAIGAASDALRLSGDVTQWWFILQTILGRQLFSGLLVWVFYVALEPYVRRLWPDTLIAWTRMLEGRLRDPLVGRHILVGALAGVLFSINFLLPTVVAPWFGVPPPAPRAELSGLLGLPEAASNVLGMLQDSLFIPITSLMVVLVLRVLLRRPWLAYATALVLVAVMSAAAQAPLPTALNGLTTAVLVIFLLTRFGLLAFVVGINFSYWYAFPLTTDSSSWYFPSSLLTMLIFAAIAVYGFVVAIGGQALFKDPVFSAERA